MAHFLKLYDGEGSRRTDALVREALNISGFELMQRAASAACDDLLSTWPNAKHVAVWCGKGNNGGDGYLLSKLLHARGLQVEVVSLVEVGSLSGDAALAHQAALDEGVVVEEALTGDLPPILADVVVDALLGTGFDGAMRANFSQAIAHINSATRPVFAIDIPSGVHAGNGYAGSEPGDAIVATQTATFITVKLGLATGRGKEVGGDVVFHSLGAPERAYAEEQGQLLRWRVDGLAPLSTNAYKHSLGQVVVVGGDRGMPGAVSLASHAALRVGAGLVTVISHAEHTDIVVGNRPEVMLLDAADERVGERLSNADVIVLGPGLGRGDWGEELFARVEAVNKPTVLDADGLYHLGIKQNWQGGRLFMTPHAGEAASVLGLSTADVTKDRVGAAQEMAQRYRASVVLKGAGSVVAGGDQLYICAHGNPGMATAGMGDVLSGIAAGLIAPAAKAQEHGFNAFAQAVALHSAAADTAAERLGQRSLLASDVIATLAELLREG